MTRIIHSYLIMTCVSNSYIIYGLCLLQMKELQTLHNLKKLFVQDLQNRVKKVQIQAQNNTLV